MISLEQLKNYYTLNAEQLISDYFTFLRFPSISSEPSYAEATRACAKWIEEYLRHSGFHTELWATSGHPVVFGSDCSAGEGHPTLLLYCHYDVQPVDPLELWNTPPFEPTIRDGVVYARGAQDNKGQCFYTLFALRALKTLCSALPLNIKIVIEGEEECGSRHLAAALEAHCDRLRADSLAIVDMGLPRADIPAVTLGCRGIVTLEVEVRGSSCDLHSGSHGGIVYNPNHALIQMLAALRGADGAIAIPDFYSDVAFLPDAMKESLYSDFDGESYRSAFGALPTGGEVAFTPLERAGIRPTIEVNGMWGGYTGEGFKTVIPAKAFAKLSCRLVPNQEPSRTAERVAAFLKQKAPPGIEVEVRILKGGGGAVRASADSSIVKAFSSVYADLFEQPCRYLFEGGSIPIIPELARVSGGEVALVGMGLNSDNIHAPNEHFSLDRLEKGVYLIALTALKLGQLSFS